MFKLLTQFLAWLFGGTGSPPAASGQTGMSEGDMHSGPHGYSPNTAYPDTEYGSQDWEAEER